MTNIQAIDLLKGLEQSLDDYCELNDEGKTAFRMAITALELFGNTEQLPSAQPEMNMDEWCTSCKEYDHERHCCPRYNRVIRKSLAEISITRCKDCKHWKVSQNNTCGIQICYLFGGVREEYDFCSRGEKA